MVVGPARFVPADEQARVEDVRPTFASCRADSAVDACEKGLAGEDRRRRVDRYLGSRQEGSAERGVVVAVPRKKVRLDECKVWKPAFCRIAFELGERHEVGGE